MAYIPGTGSTPVTIATGGIADGGDVTQGAIADAAVITNAPGTISGKLRGLVAILADVWNSVTHMLRVDASGTTLRANIINLPTPTLPPNAAQETGGNLATIAAQDTLIAQYEANAQQQIQLLQAVVNRLDVLILMEATVYGVNVNPEDALNVFPLN